MADVKISQLPASTTPLDGTEVLPIVQSATTKQVSIANVTAGRAVSALSMTLTNALPVTSGGTGIATADQGALLSATSANTFSATRTPTLGLAGTAAGTLGLSGLTSGVVTLQTAATAGTWSLTLPTTGGTSGYVLTTNGSGVSTWTAPSALSGALTVGTSAVTSGTDKYVLYNNNGTLGNYAVTGTGTTVVLSTSPTFTTGFTSPLHIGGTTASSSLTLQSTSGVGTSDSILFKVGNNGATTAATIDSAGNLGLGVTPSAWATSTALQIGSYSAVYQDNSSGACEITSNAYKSASSTWRYLATAGVSRYSSNFGAHYWYNAPSGTAGNAISFTQAMTLDANGTFRVKGAGTAGSTDAFLIDGAASASAARITSGGDLLIGTTSSGSGKIVVNNTPTSQWGIDFAQSTVTVANNSNATIPAGAGMIILTDGSQTGCTGMYIVGGGGVTLAAGTTSSGGTTLFVTPTTTPAVGKACVAYDGANYRIYNNQGNSIGFTVAMLRSRNAN